MRATMPAAAEGEGQGGDNTAPIALPDSAATPEDTPVTIAVLSNDWDPDGDWIFVVDVTQPPDGTVTFTAQDVIYTPWYDDEDPEYQYGYTGFDDFYYEIEDSAGQIAEGWVTVYVTSNDYDNEPWPRDDLAETAEDDAVTIELLANDFDAEASLALDWVDESSEQGGTVTIVDAQSGLVEYQPPPDFFGWDGFSYSVVDSEYQSAWAYVVIDVGSVNDQPTPQDDLAYSGKDATVTIYIENNDTDPDNDIGLEWQDLIVADVTQPVHGTVWFTDEEVTYTPNPAFLSGTDTFSYTLTDGHGAIQTAAVTVTMVEVTDWTLQRQKLDGTWVSVPDGEVSWSHDDLRWTASFGPADPPEVQGIDWLAKPWDQRDDPAVAWEVFASGSSDVPAEGNPGAGEWAITPSVQLSMPDQTPFAVAMAQPKRKIVAEIEEIEWATHGNPSEAAEVIDPGPGSLPLTAHPDAPPWTNRGGPKSTFGFM